MAWSPNLTGNWICRYQEDPVGASAMWPRRRGEHMIEQTYSVLVQIARIKKKWHLSSFLPFAFRRGGVLRRTLMPLAQMRTRPLDELLTVDDYPELRSLDLPPSTYIYACTNRMRETVARSAKGNPFPTSPRLYMSAHGLSLAPLELLEGGQRFWHYDLASKVIHSLKYMGPRGLQTNILLATRFWRQ